MNNKPVKHVANLIGNTPLLELDCFDTGTCRLFAKMEILNPTGSLKDRIALAMIQQAEEQGLLCKGDTIVEGTAGNTGISLLMVAASRGYKLCCVIPDKMSRFKIDQLQRMGAEVVLARSDVGQEHPQHFMQISRMLGNQPGHFFIDQFSNPANIDAHYSGTGPEIARQLDNRVDAFIAGTGTGGTITGVGRYLKTVNSEVQIVLADPQGSILANQFDSGMPVVNNAWLSEGVGTDFIPPLLDMSVVTDAVVFDNQETVACTHSLMHKAGIFAGPSTGGVLAATLRFCRKQTRSLNVVILIADSGMRYMDTVYNPQWLKSKGVDPALLL